MGYRPALDGLRAVAIAAVVGGHVYGWPRYGGAGVELFFVLSGFLITSLLLEEQQVRGHVSLSAFYRRRAYRLLPALYVMLAAFAVLFAVTGRFNRHAWVGIAAALTYVTNFLGASFAGIPFELQVLWTLAQEEQFYVLWPPLLILVFRGRLRPALIAASIGALIALVQTWATARGDLTWIGSGPLTQSLGILLGCVTALVLRLAPGILSWSRIATWPSLVIVVGMMIYLPGIGFYPYSYMIFCAACAVLVLAAFEGTALTARALLASRPLVFLGKVSYSLYLWSVLVVFAIVRYWPLNWLTRISSVALAIAVATASYHLVEMPFLRRKRRLSLKATSPRMSAEVDDRLARTTEIREAR
jgi:peptidoglycan/LPS O-acetylase OafA/YrhL